VVIHFLACGVDGTIQRSWHRHMPLCIPHLPIRLGFLLTQRSPFCARDSGPIPTHSAKQASISVVERCAGTVWQRSDSKQPHDTLETTSGLDYRVPTKMLEWR